MTETCSIFISYRRSDEPGYVRALASDLRHFFGNQQVFLDMETIEGGTDFAKAIEQAVDGCEVFLAVIGPSWLTVVDEHGEPRISDPDDFVALEIASALNLDIPVIPVLVREAPMPSRRDLPERLQPMASFQATLMSHDRWEDDIQNLISAIEKLTVAPRLARQFSEAREQLNEGNWKKAMEEFRAVEAEKPDYPHLSEVIRPLRELEEALEKSQPENRPTGRLALKYPLLLILAVTLLPHMMAGVFNYVFNRQVIVEPMQARGVETAVSVFETSSALINSVLFPVGIMILILLIRPVTKGIKEVLAGASLPLERLIDLRHRCLRLGHMIALVGISIWVVAGPVYPALVGALELRDYLLFISSLVISGLAVAAYPYMLVSWLCTRLYYRPLLIPGLDTANELSNLARVDSMKWKYFLLTGAIPMLVISMGFILGPIHSSPESINTLLGFVGLIGLVGFLLALLLFKAIQGDFRLLRQLIWAFGRK